MGLLRTLGSFLGGAVAGMIAGAAAAALLAPQSGDDLKLKIQNRVEAGKQARVDAEVSTARAMRQRFRDATNDPAALSNLDLPRS